MGAPGIQLDRTVSVESETLRIVRQLLTELGSPRAIEELRRLGGRAHLERDLGLGSLERVELLLRLNAAFSIRLPDHVVAEADTVADLIAAALSAEPGTDNGSAEAGARTYPATRSAASTPSRHPAFDPATAETLTEILRHRGRAEPGQTHIHLYEENEKLRAITYGELLSRAGAVAASLERRGLEPGATVAIMLPTVAEFFFTFAGVLLAGGIPVPIYPPFRADRIEEYAARQAGILRNAEAQFLVTFREAQAIARLMEPRVPSLRGVISAARLAQSDGPALPPETEQRPAETFGHRARGSDIAFLQYTSGSTGDPKGVVLTHANLLANIRSIVEGVSVRSDDVAVSWLPLYHDMGLIGAWFVPLYTGIPLVVMSPLAFLSRPERWLWALHRHRGTLTPAPNFAFELCVRRIAGRDIEGLDLSSVRGMLNGAEPVRAETIERFAARFARYGLRREVVMPVYGLAEASLGISAPAMGSGFKVDRIERGTFENEGRAVPAARNDSTALEFVFAGKPFPGVEVRLVDAEGHEVPERVEGRLWFRGPAATSGYYRNPDATRELLREDGFLDSGDLAYFAEGEIYITGRAKDVIIKGGRNISPQEVEEIAGRVAGVRTGCVIAFGVPDAQSGTEKLIVTAETRAPAEAGRIAADITAQISDALGFPPDRVELLPPHSIPKTSSGKLRRSETRRLYLAGQLGKPPGPIWMQVGRLAARGALPQIFTITRKGAARGAEFVYGVYAIGIVGALFVPLWLLTLIAPNRMAAARLIRFFARLMLFSAGIRVEREGCELLDQLPATGPWIFAPNHSSYLDFLVAFAFLPLGARFVAKGETASMPIMSTLARRGRHFTFKRSDPQARIGQSKQIEEALRQGDSVVIYPEGTFTAASGIRPFQLGAFKAAVEAGRPICPVAVRGARKILRDETYLPKIGRVAVRFGPLLSPNCAQSSAGAGTSDWQEMVRLRDATREIIAQHTGEPLL
ncbi:MAG: AMP-binding protein [Candidatus Acidiferrales bacterium]